LTPVQDLAYTRLILSRVRAAIPPEPASCIARALHRRLADRIRGARIPLGAGDVQLCTGDLCQTLSEAEAHDTRALFVPGELIRGVHDDPVKALIATKLLEIGHGLGVGTIVEGIEEQAELSWVRDHGAVFVQGFLLGKPAPVVRS
jgi:hypothetical protein